jgi:hypothetical protein
MMKAEMTWSSGWQVSTSVSFYLVELAWARVLNVRVESASADRIWATLTPEERTRFTRAMHDPASELAKTLLASPELVNDMPAPWWVASSTTPPANVPTIRPTRPPDIMALPEALLTAPTPPPPAPAFPLAYNLVAIL